MSFGLSNPSATFHSNIDDCIRPYIDDFAKCYLDDILIYSTNKEEDEEQALWVLQRVREFGLYCQAEKCQFGVSEVGFLGFVITPDGVSMQSDRISTIEYWPPQKSVRDIQVLLRFTKFYGRFIRKYAKVSLPLVESTNKSETSRSKKLEGSARREWTQEAELAFWQLKRSCTEAPILQHIYPAKPSNLRTDTSGSVIAGIVNQYDVFRVLRPVNFYCQWCSRTEQNHDSCDREQLAIVQTPKQWLHYVYGANFKVLIWCDHKNLEHFQTSNVLSREEARWSEILSAYDFVIEHLEGSKNPFNGPSRLPDYGIGYETPVAWLLANISVEPYDDLMAAIVAA